MSTGATVAVVVGGLALVGGGVVAFMWYGKRQKEQAAGAAAAAAVAARNLETAKTKAKKSLGEAIADLGAKALSEGAKLVTRGPQGYASDVATRLAKAA